jgi:hypothetical protein
LRPNGDAGAERNIIIWKYLFRFERVRARADVAHAREFEAQLPESSRSAIPNL